MKITTTKWQTFVGKAKVSMWRRCGCNIEIQEMYELKDEGSKVAPFIDEIEKFKVFALPKEIERNHAGIISQTFNSKRHGYKGVFRYYVLVNTVMRVAEWDKGRTDHDDFIAPHILH